MSFVDHFVSSNTVETTHVWTLSKRNSSIIVEELAMIVAHEVVHYRLRGQIYLYDAWKNKTSGIQFPSPKYSILLKTFLGPVFGVPNDEVPDDHLEGYVGEFLWYLLHREGNDPSIVHIEPPSFKVTDQGGDGLIIHRTNGNLMFRLWEMKKCTGSNSVSSTVNTAYNQLDSNALEYLARYSTVGQELSDTELSVFYGQLLDHWLDASESAAIGISVTTSFDSIPSQCFTTFGNKFPKFTSPPRLHGLLTAVEDFAVFSKKVRDIVWSGL